MPVGSPLLRSYAPVILSRFSRYVLLTLLTPTFRGNWCWFRLGATLCHDVLRCCHAIATPEPRYCPVLTRLTSDTGKFSCVVLRCVSLPSRCSLAVAMLSYAVPRIWRSIACSILSYCILNWISCLWNHYTCSPLAYSCANLAMKCYLNYLPICSLSPYIQHKEFG